MAKFRIGLGSDFSLKNGKLGVGLTSDAQERLDVAGVVKAKDLKVSGISSLTGYKGFLRADHQIAENTTLSFDQGPSASLSGEIIVGTGVTVTVERVGLGTATIGVGIGTTDSTTDTTDFTRAGGSEIECLKVYNTFTPPSGGTNERPYAPKPGELYYNYDFKTIEFFDGFDWRQVEYTTRSGRVVIAGGYGPLGVPAAGTGVKSMQSMQVMTLGSAQYFGELDQVNTEHTGCGSEIRGVLGGGYVAPARVDIIQYVTIASASNGHDFGNLTQGRNQAQAVSSSTRGIWAGGFGPSYRDEIDYVEISTVGNALDFGDLTFAHSPGATANSPTRGVFLSGYTPSNPYSGSEFISIASKGNGTDFGECSTLIAGGSCGSNTRGIFGGGYTRNPASVSTKTLQYVTMASFGNAIDFGSLVNNMTYGSAGGNSVRGVFTGSDGSPYTNTNIDYVSVTSLGNAEDFGDLAIKTGYAGAVSDSHGGLGGF